MDRWMDGWMDRWMDGWMDEWIKCVEVTATVSCADDGRHYTCYC